MTITPAPIGAGSLTTKERFDMPFEEIEVAAKEATNGKWISGYGDTAQLGSVFGVGIQTEPDWTPIAVLSLESDVNSKDIANAKYLELACPENIICIIEEIKRLKNLISFKDEALLKMIRFDNFSKTYNDTQDIDISSVYDEVIEFVKTALNTKEI